MYLEVIKLIYWQIYSIILFSPIQLSTEIGGSLIVYYCCSLKSWKYFRLSNFSWKTKIHCHIFLATKYSCFTFHYSRDLQSHSLPFTTPVRRCINSAIFRVFAPFPRRTAAMTRVAILKLIRICSRQYTIEV